MSYAFNGALTGGAPNLNIRMHMRTALHRDESVTESGMKSERVTLLTTPEFKAFLAAEARRENISVAELVRSRCERRPREDEALLAGLTAELRAAVAQAKKSLRQGLAEAEVVLEELRSKRAADVGARKPSRRRGRAPE